MKRLPLTVIAEKINGTVIRGTTHQIIRNVVTGNRRVKQGTLLFDLFRATHRIQNIGSEKYLAAIVTDKPEDLAGLSENITIVKVPSIREAYWKFIDFYRNLFNIPVIGVTGTCGKTTTKEMIAHILSGSFKVNATYKSYNALFRNLNYLLEINDRTQAAVYEMGLAFRGDLKISCRYFQPQVGVITNIGIDHMQAFQTLDAYIKGKAELLAGLNYRGTLVLNGDDLNIKKIDLQKFNGKVLYFGFDDRSHFRISSVTSEDEVIQFQICVGHETYRVSIPGLGEFNVYNAAAAIAAVNAIGLPIAEAAARLASFRNVEKHFEIKQGINGSTVIDDTWSTNPTSVAAALNLLKSHARGRKTIAVLGEMALLGHQSAAYHFMTGEKAAEIGIDRLIVMGDGADQIGYGALHNGMDPTRVHFCKDSAATREVLAKLLNAHTIALIKTSMLASYTELIHKITIQP